MAGTIVVISNLYMYQSSKVKQNAAKIVILFCYFTSSSAAAAAAAVALS